jgi:HPt (histidine-containing phosphotransfer) domain-containing protein
MLPVEPAVRGRRRRARIPGTFAADGSVSVMAASGLYALRVTVRPDPDLMDLIPVYLERRNADLIALEDALLLGDMERVRILGHSMKGSGGGYGFDGITEIGLRLEIAGRDGDASAARTGMDDLAEYLRNVDILDG